MADDRLDLGAHWEDFIAAQVAEGHYGSAADVLREALRRMEADAEKLAALRAHIQEGLDDIEAGNYVAGFDPDEFIDRAKRETNEKPAAE